jgi:hypothetical protein
MAACASTRSCRCASSRCPACCRANRPSRPSRRRSEDLRQEGRRGGRAQPRAVDAALAHLHEVPVPAAVPEARSAAADGPARGAPDFVQRVTAAMIAGPRRQAAGERLPADGTWPVGTAAGRSATSRRRSRSGTRRSASSATSARWSARTPPSARQGLRPERRPRRPGTFKSTAWKGKEFGGVLRRSGGARGLHGLRPLRRGLPREGQEEPAPQGHRHDAASAPARGRARQLRVLPEACRRPRASRSRTDSRAAQFLRRCSSTRAPARAAARRRTSSSHADVRRPHGHRQRHGLLVDLRRQPAHDALHDQRGRAAGRRGPTRCSRTTPSSASASASRSTRAARAPTLTGQATRLGVGDALVGRPARSPQAATRRTSRRSASAWSPCGERLARRPRATPTRGGC